MKAQRAFGHCGGRFVISLQLTLVFLVQAQPWSLTCKTHVLLLYEAIFLDYHAQLGKTLHLLQRNLWRASAPWGEKMEHCESFAAAQLLFPSRLTCLRKFAIPKYTGQGGIT